MKSVKWRVCPICGNAYTTYPAISRKDNKTEICPKCGQQEALDAFLVSKMENSDWISVKDKLPPPNQEVLIWHKGIGRYRVDVARYREEHKNWQLPHWVSESVTHWMPLPEPPKGE